MENYRLAFLGAGNIARAIIGGLVAHGHPPERISAADPMVSQLEQLPRGVATHASNARVTAEADVIIVCVKPDRVRQVASDIASAATGKLVISVAAGIPVRVLEAELGPDTSIIRCMPNTPALVGQGMTGLYANDNVTAAQREAGELILSSVGKTLWFDAEDQLDMVTAVSGSGPAYFFLVMELIEKAGIGLGLSPGASRQLVLQTALGAAQMASSVEDSPETLRLRVTSKGGTTEAAIDSLLNSGLPGHFERAIDAAYRRSKELAATEGS
jgi:pyrroline-5-carboxylate reductase